LLETMKQKQSNLWRLVSKSLGEKSGKTDKEADQIALIRLLMFLSIFITNAFIVANALRHWNDIQLDKPVKCIIVDKL
jgi:hypothetical protein